MAGSRAQSSSPAVPLTALVLLGLAYIIGSIQAVPVAEAEIQARRVCPTGWVLRLLGTAPLPVEASDDAAIDSPNARRRCYGLCCINGTNTCLRKYFWFPCNRTLPEASPIAVEVEKLPEEAPAAAAADEEALFEFPVDDSDLAAAVAESFDFEIPADAEQFGPPRPRPPIRPRPQPRPVPPPPPRPIPGRR